MNRLLLRTCMRPFYFASARRPLRSSSPRKPDHAFASLLRDGEKGLPLPSFRMHAGLKIEAQNIEKDISSPNVVAVLPGSDPKLADGVRYPVSAPRWLWLWDARAWRLAVQTETLDDAAYVALLIEVAKSLHGKAPGRSLLFCVFTGEEKGLLGSAYFIAHLMVPPGSIVADLNLDQLRPIFPLKILTMEGIDDSSLGETVKTPCRELPYRDTAGPRAGAQTCIGAPTITTSCASVSRLRASSSATILPRLKRLSTATGMRVDTTSRRMILQRQLTGMQRSRLNRFYQQLAVNDCECASAPSVVARKPERAEGLKSLLRGGCHFIQVGGAYCPLFSAPRRPALDRTGRR